MFMNSMISDAINKKKQLCFSKHFFFFAKNFTSKKTLKVFF